MTTGLFERADIRALSEKLLGLPPGQGVLLSSAAGRVLDDMLMSVSGVQSGAVHGVSSPSGAVPS